MTPTRRSPDLLKPSSHTPWCLNLGVLSQTVHCPFYMEMNRHAFIWPCVAISIERKPQSYHRCAWIPLVHGKSSANPQVLANITASCLYQRNFLSLNIGITDLKAWLPKTQIVHTRSILCSRLAFLSLIVSAIDISRGPKDYCGPKNKYCLVGASGKFGPPPWVPIAGVYLTQGMSLPVATSVLAPPDPAPLPTILPAFIALCSRFNSTSSIPTMLAIGPYLYDKPKDKTPPLRKRHRFLATVMRYQRNELHESLCMSLWLMFIWPRFFECFPKTKHRYQEEQEQEFQQIVESEKLLIN